MKIKIADFRHPSSPTDTAAAALALCQALVPGSHSLALSLSKGLAS